MAMKRLKDALLTLRDINLPEWAAPVFIFLVCFFSFGMLLSRLGFFQDDWHHVFYAYWQGAQGLKRFLTVDRGPFAYVIYVFFFRVLGFSPAHWHWSLMLIRFLTAFVFWLSMRQIWPGRNGLTTWLALFFAIYPVFMLQPLSVAYTLHWVMYLVFMASLFLMLYAIRHPKAYLAATIVAVLFQATQLAFIEYFSGLELSRLIFLWFVFSNLPARERIGKTLRYSLPYLITLILYVIYRSSFSVLFGYDRFAIFSTLAGLAQSPITGLTALLQSMFQDIVYILVTPWYSAVDPSLIDLSRPLTYLIFASVLGFAVLTYYVISRLEKTLGERDVPGLGRQIAVAGLVSLILAILPFWLAGFSIFQKNLLWSDRLALAAMVGASMIVTGGIYTIIEKSFTRNLVLSLLLGLGIGLHVQNARSYQSSWDKQEQFYWQLYWRAPSLQPNTMIVADQEILYFMGIYPTAFAINMLYPQVTTPPVASYWFNAGYEHINWLTFNAGEPATFEKYATTFTANNKNILSITFEPGQGQCLWVLRPEYADVQGLTSPAYDWMSISNPSRIEPDSQYLPPPDIFGNEPDHGWCYFYEKADLARPVSGMGNYRRAMEGGRSEGSTSQQWHRVVAFHSGFRQVRRLGDSQENHDLR